MTLLATAVQLCICTWSPTLPGACTAKNCMPPIRFCPLEDYIPGKWWQLIKSRACLPADGLHQAWRSHCQSSTMQKHQFFGHLTCLTCTATQIHRSVGSGGQAKKQHVNSSASRQAVMALLDSRRRKVRQKSSGTLYLFAPMWHASQSSSPSRSNSLKEGTEKKREGSTVWHAAFCWLVCGRCEADERHLQVGQLH